MWSRVMEYALIWNAPKDKGVIQLKLENGDQHDMDVDSASELTALGDLLRHEKPIYYKVGVGEIRTGWEPAGEEELN